MVCVPRLLCQDPAAGRVTNGINLTLLFLRSSAWLPNVPHGAICLDHLFPERLPLGRFEEIQSKSQELSGLPLIPGSVLAFPSNGGLGIDSASVIQESMRPFPVLEGQLRICNRL